MDDDRSRSRGTAQQVEVLLDSARDLVRMLGSLSDASANQASAMADLERENRDFSARLVELEQQQLDLVKLYVASHQLHSTLEMEEVLATAVEIVINLIGGAKIAIYTLVEPSTTLTPAVAEGASRDELPSVELEQGIIGRSVSTRETFCSEDRTREEPGDPIVCIPLWQHEQPIGAIVIYELLEQKTGFEPIDHQLFTLLARQAATAIYSARLFALSNRKLDTFRGFIDALADDPGGSPDRSPMR